MPPCLSPSDFDSKSPAIVELLSTSNGSNDSRLGLNLDPNHIDDDLYSTMMASGGGDRYKFLDIGLYHPYHPSSNTNLSYTDESLSDSMKTDYGQQYHHHHHHHLHHHQHHNYHYSFGQTYGGIDFDFDHHQHSHNFHQYKVDNFDNFENQDDFLTDCSSGIHSSSPTSLSSSFSPPSTFSLKPIDNNNWIDDCTSREKNPEDFIYLEVFLENKQSNDGEKLSKSLERKTTKSTTTSKSKSMTTTTTTSSSSSSTSTITSKFTSSSSRNSLISSSSSSSSSSSNQTLPNIISNGNSI